MSNIFVAKPLKNASIVTAILLRVDTTKNMLIAHYNIYACIYIYIYTILFKRGMPIVSVCTFI